MASFLLVGKSMATFLLILSTSTDVFNMDDCSISLEMKEKLAMVMSCAAPRQLGESGLGRWAPGAPTLWTSSPALRIDAKGRRLATPIA